MKNLVAVLAACVALAGGSAIADEAIDPTDADMRCAALGLYLVGATGADSRQQQGAMMIATYYLGRIQGRTPDINLEETFRQMGATLTPAQLEAERGRCGAEFATFGRTMIEMGQNLQAQPR